MTTTANNTTFNRADILRATVNTLNKGRNEFNSITLEQVKQIIDTYQHTIDSMLASANQLDKTVTVKPLNGLQITAQRKAACHKRIGGDTVSVPEQTYLTAIVSKCYKRNLNESINKAADKE